MSSSFEAHLCGAEKLLDRGVHFSGDEFPKLRVFALAVETHGELFAEDGEGRAGSGLPLPSASKVADRHAFRQEVGSSVQGSHRLLSVLLA